MISSARLFRGPSLQTDACIGEGILSPKPLSKVDPLTSHVPFIVNGFLPKSAETDPSWVNLWQTSGFSIQMQLISMSNAFQYNVTPSFCTDINLHANNTTTSYPYKTAQNFDVKVASMARNLVEVGVRNSDTELSIELRLSDGNYIKVSNKTYHTKDYAKVILAIRGATSSGDKKTFELAPDFTGEPMPVSNRLLTTSRLSEISWCSDSNNVTILVDFQPQRPEMRFNVRVVSDSLLSNLSGSTLGTQSSMTLLLKSSPGFMDASAMLGVQCCQLQSLPNLSLKEILILSINLGIVKSRIPLSISENVGYRYVTKLSCNLNFRKEDNNTSNCVFSSSNALLTSLGLSGPSHVCGPGNSRLGQSGFTSLSVRNHGLKNTLYPDTDYRTSQSCASPGLSTKRDNYVFPQGIGNFLAEKARLLTISSTLAVDQIENQSVYLGLGPEPAELEIPLDETLPDPGTLHIETEAINSQIISEFMQISNTRQEASMSFSLVRKKGQGCVKKNQSDRVQTEQVQNEWAQVERARGEQVQYEHHNYSEPSSPPREEVQEGNGIEGWEWRLLEYENPEDILENIEGQPFEVNTLMDDLLNQAEQPVELVPPRENDPQIIRGYDSDSGSFGGSIHDPDAPWLPQDTSQDSGTDDRMVNVPIYFNQHNISLTSSQLDFENWQDIFAPGAQQWDQNWEAASDSSSEYGPLGEFLGALNTSSTPSNPSLASSPPVSPPWPALAVQPESSTPVNLTSPISPVHVHLEGCICLKCIRFSPIEGEGHGTFSYPVDLEAVARRLQAHIESVNLLVDVDRIHWNAELEEENMISEYYYRQSDEFIEDEIVFWNESEGHMGFRDIMDSIEKSEQELVDSYWRSVQASDTRRMVAMATTQYAQSQWERRQLENASLSDVLSINVTEELIKVHSELDKNQTAEDIPRGLFLLGYKQERPP